MSDALLREAEILSLEVLGRPVLPALQSLVDLSQHLLGGAMVELNVVTATHTIHLATSDRHQGRVPVGDSFCSRVVQHPERTMSVPDAMQDPRFADSPYVDGTMGSILSYTGTQLTSRDGTAYGTLCTWDTEHRPLLPSQVEVLERLAELAGLVLEQHRDAARLARSVQDIASSHRLLGRSNESLSQLAGQLGHDLRSPLAAMRLSLDLLAERPSVQGDRAAATLAEKALLATTRMDGTLGELIEFAVNGGDGAVPVDLDEVLAEVVDGLGPLLEDAHLRTSRLPVVAGHGASLEAVLQNLLSNAVKFARSEGAAPLIDVSAEVAAGRAVVRVDDNGPGVPAGLRAAVFELGDRGERAHVEGHGIGLATCARVLSQLGGSIGVEDSALGGASFWFELSLAERPVAVPETVTSTPTPSPG